MVKQLVCDELWVIIERLLPSEPDKSRGGRPREISNRQALEGILYVLKTGIPWEMLPLELGYGSGMTCWRRLRDWQGEGVWRKLHQALLEKLNKASALDWSRAAVDSGSVPAPAGGEHTGPNPTDRAKSGSKRHIVVDLQGIPLGVTQSGANVHDSQMLEQTIDAIPALRQPRGGPRKRPRKVHTDKGYDFRRCRQALRRRGIIPRIARRGIESSSHLGKYRWVVERTLSWLKRFRRLNTRWEFRDDIHLAFLTLGCAMICWRFAQRLC